MLAELREQRDRLKDELDALTALRDHRVEMTAALANQVHLLIGWVDETLDGLSRRATPASHFLGLRAPLGEMSTDLLWVGKCNDVLRALREGDVALANSYSGQIAERLRDSKPPTDLIVSALRAVREALTRLRQTESSVFHDKRYPELARLYVELQRRG
jgi:hypothetical protein